MPGGAPSGKPSRTRPNRPNRPLPLMIPARSRGPVVERSPVKPGFAAPSRIPDYLADLFRRPLWGRP